MTNNDLIKLLNNKSKPQLQVLAENIGLKGISRLSKEKLIAKIISSSSKDKILEELELNKTKKWYKNNWVDFVFFVFSLVFTVLISPSKNDIKSLGEKVSEERLEYLEEIIYLEQYKRIFLEKEMNYSYKVFGKYQGELVTKEELSNPNWILNYRSDIELDFDEGFVDATLFLDEFVTGTGYEMLRNRINQKFFLKENEFFEFGIKSNYCLKFVLLKADRVQPVFAIGVGNCINPNNQ